MPAVGEAAPRRPDAAFVFQVFDLENGLDIDHQYDRSAGVPRPWKPLILRIDVADGYDEVTVMGTPASAAVDPTIVAATGTRYPARKVGSHWEAVLPGMEDGTLFHYVVAARSPTGETRYADGARPIDDARVFTHRVTTRRPPRWTRDAVVYQIFVDRYATAAGPVAPPRAPRGWAGGDLDGVTASLPYLSDLGIDVIWLTPVFECHSYHGYDTLDFKRVDDRFGGDRALAALVDEATARDIRIVLDFVPNHVSNLHPWFVDALAGGPTRDWFTFHPDGSYAGFFGSKTMPKVDLTHPDAVAAFLDVAGYWVGEFGIAGYRIDHVLGPVESFFAVLSADMNARHPDAWLFGEATASAAYCRRYGGILDGATDFMLAYAWRDYLAGKLSVRGLVEVEQEAAAVLAHDDFSWVRFFDNHDMSRALQVWGDDIGRLRAALDMLLGLPGVPSVFYGTEQGLTHEIGQEVGGLEVGRVPMRFDDPHGLVHDVRELITTRRRSATAHGDPVRWAVDGESATWQWGGRAGAVGAVAHGTGPINPR